MNTYFFIGIGGSGMSAIAQYLVGKGNNVSGSDRVFAKSEGQDIKHKLENEGIKCYIQGESIIDKNTDYIVVSTAIEDNVPEYVFAKVNNIKIIHRSDLLAEIASKNKTIAVCGTSGKSTTTAMIYCILEKNGFSPSLISGAGLIELQEKGKIGNAAVGNSDILVIETDESDGTIVKYHPEIGVILNIDRDHKEIEELMVLFSTFAQHTKSTLIVNQDNNRSKSLSKDITKDFSCKNKQGNFGECFSQNIEGISFYTNNTEFKLSVIGQHNMQNAMAAIAVAREFNIPDTNSADALSKYKGIFRRNRIVYSQNNITIMDDFAHNPAKICASISACQAISKRVIAWFQPHGFAPSKLMKNELIESLTNLLRPDDQILFSKIYYAGGTANQTISAEEFTNELILNHIKSKYIENRDEIIPYLTSIAQSGDIILLMGARDPSLEYFAKNVCNAFNN
ncbi:MAG: Mur ligase domain-containing protein [Bacteroidales bacterium]|nr:Mur ligase domain-containing protein [Bacteroidales bacterium]